MHNMKIGANQTNLLLKTMKYPVVCTHFCCTECISTAILLS